MAERKILVIDDTLLNRDLVQAVVEDIVGYACLLAEGAEQAQAILAEHTPDLILLDLAMPDVDGYALLQRLKSNPDTCDIPVVAVTALAFAADRERAFDLGVDDYVLKPFEVTELADVIHRFVPED